MRDILKSKKRLIQELEETRGLLSQKATEGPKADVQKKDASYRGQEALVLIRKAIDSTTDAIGLSDSEGHHIYQNKAFTNLFEYSVEELEAAGGGPVAFSVKSIAREVFGAIMSGSPWSGEVEMKAKSGRLFNLFLRADAIKDDAGKTVGLVGVFTDISERKRLEYQLRKKHDELQLILDSIPAYVFYKDKHGKMLNINKAATSLTYMPKEKLLQRTVFDLTPQAADQYNRDDMEVIRSGEPKINIEEPLVLPVGTRWLKTDKLPIKDDEGNVAGLVGFSVDITELKSAQEELREKEALLRTFFNSPGLICGIVELEVGDLRYITVNTAMAEMYGLKPEEVSNKLASEIGTDREIVELFIDNYKKSQKNNTPVYFEYQRGSGPKMQWFFVTVTFLGLEPVRYRPRFAFVTSDITERTEAEEALRNSEEKLRLMFASMADGVVVTDIEGKIIDVNEAQLRMFGFKEKSELTGKGGFDFLAVRERGRALADMFAVHEKGFNTGSTYIVVGNNGREFECELSTALLHDAAGKASGTVTVMRDVTERRRMEQAVKESEERYRLLAENVSDVIWTMDLNLKYTYVSPSVESLRGFTAEEAMKMSIEETLTPDSIKTAMQVLKEELGADHSDQYTSRTIEVELKCKDGSTVWTEMNLSWLRDSKGNRVGIMGVTRDIAERRKAEQKIKESEERYRLFAENVSDVIWTMDLDIKYTYVSPSIERMRGFTPEEFIGVSAKETLSEKSFKLISERLVQELAVERAGGAAPGRITTLELEAKKKDGSWMWIEVKITFIRDSEGKAIGMLGVTRDISERKRVEEALREASEKLQVIFNSIGEAVTVVDLNGDIGDANKEALRLHGFDSKEAIIGRKASEMVAPVDRDRAVNDAIKALKSPYPSARTEYKLIDINGREFDGEFNVAVIKDNKGKPTGFIGIARDISERKRAAELQSRLAAIVEFSQDAIIGKTLDGIITSWNHGAEMLYGYTAGEIIGSSVSVLAPAEHVDEIASFLEKIPTGEAIRNYETVRVAKDGRRITVLLTLSPIKDASGKVVAASTIAQNISERKQMEEALKKSAEYFKEITENSSDIVIITNKNGDIKYCSRSIERFAGYKPEELIGKSAFKFIHPDDVQRAVSNFGEAILSKDAIPNAFRVVHKDGSVRFFDGLGRNLLDNPSIAGFIMNVRDVTERNKIEEALRDSEEKLRVMFDSMIDGIVVSDQNIKIVDVNKAVLEMTGEASKEDLIGRSAMDVIRFKDQEAAMANLSKMLQEARPQEKVEYSVMFPSGKQMEIEVSTAMMHDNAGNLIGFVNAIRDISERKTWEEILRKSEEKYRNLVEREKDVIVSVDALGFVKSVNSAAKMWGYSPDELMNMNFLDLIAPEWREVTATELQSRLLASGEYTGETMSVNKNGDLRPIEYSAVVVEEGGKYAGAQAIVRDISERKKAEEAVQARERYFRAITDLSSGAALVVSQEGNILDVTGGLESISGHTRAETIGRSALEFIHPEDLEKAGVAFAEVLRNPGKTVVFEARLKNVRGEWQWTESMITNLLDNPNVYGIVNHLVDITERKRTEEKIRNHAKRIEALYSVAQVISHSSMLEAMLNDSLDRVCSAMSTESGCIFMLDLDENALKLKAWRGVAGEIVQQFSSIAMTEQGIENLVNLAVPITAIDETQGVIEPDKMKKVTTELGRRGIAAVPFFSGEDFQGLLVVFTSEYRTFSGEDLDFFKTAANEISIGINNVMLLEKTRELSVTDELTGLYNRRYFFEMLDVEMHRSVRTKHPFSLVMIDLDGFKEYNDKYGHSNGDAVLQAFSQMLEASIRKTDLAFRYGGDEFALALPGADAGRAKKIVQRMRTKWQKLPLTQSKIVGGHVGFSSGIAEYPENAESSDGLIFLADAALYQAKKKGYEDKLVSELRTLSTDIMDVATQDQVYALAATVDARDPYTYGHSQRVSDIALAIGTAIGMTQEDLAKLHAAALLHDIGKVGVPDAILTKMGKPTAEEWDVIKKHCSEGARILSYVKELSNLVPVVLHHHEWFDGSGYPGGLKGMDIPSGARITSVADAYDTMVTKRPYRDVITPKEACEELQRCAGTQFDPAIVDIWCKLVEEEGK